MKLILLAILLALCSVPAHATVVNPSGGDDTAAMQKVCSAGQILQLTKGVVMDNVHGMRLTNVTVVDTSGVSGACVDANTAGMNQELVIQGGLFQDSNPTYVDQNSQTIISLLGPPVMDIPVTYIGDDSKEHKGKLVQFVCRSEHIDQVGQFHRARCMGIVRHGRRFVEVPREAIDPGDE